MNDSEHFAMAARLYTALKRSSGRVIDVIWLMQDEAYAREVLRLSEAAGGECAELAARYELYRRSDKAKPAAAPAAHTATGSFAAASTHYVRGLR